jgi:uncharacterized protein
VRARFTGITNGTVLTDTALSLIDELSMSVSVSLDPGSEVHDASRRTLTGAPTYHQVVRNLGRLRSRLPPGRILVRSTLAPGSAAAMGSFLEQLRSLGVERVNLRWPSIPELEEDQIQETLDCFRIAAEWSAGCFERDEVPPRVLNFTRPALRALLSMPSSRYCGYGPDMVCLTPGGRVSTCHRRSTPAGAAASDSTTRIGNGPRPSCQKCWARRLCGGGCPYDLELWSSRADGDESLPIFCRLARGGYELALALLHRALECGVADRWLIPSDRKA